MRPHFRLAFPASLVLGALVAAPLLACGQDERPKESGKPPTVAMTPDATLEALLAAHNKVRAEEKRPPLTFNARLTVSARGHARDMAEHNKLSHEGSDGSDPKTRIKRTNYHYQEIGENVADGQETVGEAMRSWIESPPHRENILGDFSEMGGAVAKGPDGRNYWCVDFGRPMPEVDPQRSPVEMIAALNRARGEAKKKALRPDPRLARVAARFARLAADRKSMETKDNDGQTPFDVLESQGFRARRFAMTLASGEGEPANVVSSWLKEPRDRDALLSGFERAGVGVATDSDGVPYWVILMAQGVAP
jgi:uncharacterized protein YkwD